MPNPETGNVPEPHVDPRPDEAPGGPDAIERDPDDYPIQTPDQPQSAQVDDAEVPDEIKQPEELDEEEKDIDPAKDAQD